MVVNTEYAGISLPGSPIRTFNATSQSERRSMNRTVPGCEGSGRTNSIVVGESLSIPTTGAMEEGYSTAQAARKGAARSGEETVPASEVYDFICPFDLLPFIGL